MRNEEIDILVIGSVAAGAVITKRLTDLGAKVMCLEQGGWIKPTDYPFRPVLSGKFNSAVVLFISALTFAGVGRIIRSQKPAQTRRPY